MHSIVKSRIRKGIPEDFRGIAWPIIARIEKFKSQFEITYKVEHQKGGFFNWLWGFINEKERYLVHLE